MTMFYEEILLPLIKSTKNKPYFARQKIFYFFGSLHDGSGSSYCLSPGLCWLRCAPPCRPQDSRADAAAFGSLNRRITFTSRVLDSHEPRKSVIYVKKANVVFSFFYKIYEKQQYFNGKYILFLFVCYKFPHFLKKHASKKIQIKSPPNGQLRQLIRFLFNYVIIIKAARIITLGTSGKSNEMLMIFGLVFVY